MSSFYHIFALPASILCGIALKTSGEAITPKAWKAEAAKLTAQKDFDYQTMRDMRDEIKAVESLRKVADRLAHEGQHQQKEQER